MILAARSRYRSALVGRAPGACRKNRKNACRSVLRIIPAEVGAHSDSIGRTEGDGSLDPGRFGLTCVDEGTKLSRHDQDRLLQIRPVVQECANFGVQAAAGKCPLEANFVAPQLF